MVRVRNLVLLITDNLHRLINKDMPLILVFKVLYVRQNSMRSEDDFLNFIRNVLHIVG